MRTHLHTARIVVRISYIVFRDVLFLYYLCILRVRIKVIVIYFGSPNTALHRGSDFFSWSNIHIATLNQLIETKIVKEI